MEAVLYTLEKNFTIVNIYVELSLQSVVNENACLDVNILILWIPVGLESDGDTIPTLGISMAEAVTNALNDALCQDSGL